MTDTTITAVLWDADGVLQHPKEGLVEHLGGLVGLENIPAVFNADEIGPMTGHRPFPEAVAEVLDDLGIVADVDEVMRSWEFIEPDPDAFAVVQSVRSQGIRCHLATNQQDTRVRYMRDTLGYSEKFDHLFFSAELGVKKPDPQYWVKIIDHLGLPADEVLFLDDLASNVQAARTVGLHAERHDPASGAQGLAMLLARHGIAVSS